MTTSQRVGKTIQWTITGIGLATAAYRASTGFRWLRYGHPAKPRGAESDRLLDRFMPAYDVVDRHRVRVAAPAEIAIQAAETISLEDSKLVRAIFRAREIALGAGEPKSDGGRVDDGGRVFRPGLLDQTKAMGWLSLAEIPGREIVMGAVTRPWEANVVFRGIPADRFAAFDEPQYVKIVWSLRADPVGPRRCIFRTETRVTTTDAEARRRFRGYWAKFAPGIVLIRRVLLAELRREAERRARLSATNPVVQMAGK